MSTGGLLLRLVCAVWARRTPISEFLMIIFVQLSRARNFSTGFIWSIFVSRVPFDAWRAKDIYRFYTRCGIDSSDAYLSIWYAFETNKRIVRRNETVQRKWRKSEKWQVFFISHLSNVITVADWRMYVRVVSDGLLSVSAAVPEIRRKQRWAELSATNELARKDNGCMLWLRCVSTKQRFLYLFHLLLNVFLVYARVKKTRDSWNILNCSIFKYLYLV